MSPVRRQLFSSGVIAWMVVLVTAVVRPAAAAAAEPPEALRAVPGAGGTVELWRSTVRLGSAVLTTPAGQRGPARARLLQVDGHPVVEVRVPVHSAAKAGTARTADGRRERTEVWIGELATSGLRRLHGEVVGARDADGETRTDAAVTPEGIFQFQSAARLVRCSGAPMRLGLRRYDFGRGRFVDTADLPPPAPVVLDATAEPAEAPRARPRVQFPFALTSAPEADDDPGPVDPRRLVAPLALSDGDPATVWLSRGVRGETLTARAASAGHQVTGLRLWPGDTRSRARLLAATRPRQLHLEFGPAADQRFEIRIDPALSSGPDGHKRPLWVALPRPVPSSCVSLSVREVTPGSDGRAGDVLAWGDVEIFTDLDGPEGSARLVQSLERPDCESRIADVVALGAEALDGLAGALAGTRGAPRDCVLEALGRIPTPAAPAPELGPALARGLAGASPTQEKAVVGLLQRLRQPPIPAVAGLLQDGAAADEDRARAARALAALASAETPPGEAGRQAQAALLAAAGQGPPAVRTAIRDALGGPGVGDLQVLHAAAAEPTTEPATVPAERRADLVLSLAARLARLQPEDAAADLLAGVRTLVALSRSEAEPFAVRARAVQGLGRVGGTTALKALVDLRTHSREAVLRRLATTALAGHREAFVSSALRAAVEDVDPEVRERASAGLGALGDTGATTLLIAGAKQEPWPSVRRAQVAALGSLCGPGASDLLARAVERDEDNVRRAALTGLVSCKDGRAVDTLLALLKRERESATLRTLAAGLLARAGNRRAAAPMAEALARLAVESQADLALEGTAVATLRALGTLGGPAALKAALAHASNPRPSLRRTAVEALGRLCDAAGTPVLSAATRDADPGVATAAAAALRRCRGSAHQTGDRLGAP